VAHLVASGKEVLVDAEHFYDGYTANPEFAVQCALAAARSGASRVVLCDTNGRAVTSLVQLTHVRLVQGFRC
jgi:2-isopropylmalate synthase